jgi:predicted dehydrogenase
MTSSNDAHGRRDLLKAASLALGSSFFPGKVLGANNRIGLAFIGTGTMGTGNLKFAMQQPDVHVVSVCDVYQPRLDSAIEVAKKAGQAPKAVHDFRQILADPTVDAVCIATPDHWHAYMAVEACKAGKDVWVEKPIAVTVDEGQKMVAAARKYNRVVQAGLMQRSGDVFEKAIEIVRSGQLGKITFVRTSMWGNSRPEGLGNPPDSEPPADLDWELWQGPAPQHAFNPNRFFHGNFRHFWDYAGGTMTDWGVHWLDIVQMAFGEAIPSRISAFGGKFCFTDNRETPDTLQVTYDYPGFVTVFELRDFNQASDPNGIRFHGTQGTLFVDRSVCRVTPEKKSELQPFEMKRATNANLAHWANFLDCMRTRKRPICDIEAGYRSSATCMLGNVAYRSRTQLDWDGRTVPQAAAQKLLSREYRSPWKLEV